jgi:hypothetical protein
LQLKTFNWKTTDFWCLTVTLRMFSAENFNSAGGGGALAGIGAAGRRGGVFGVLGEGIGADINTYRRKTCSWYRTENV